MKDIPNHPLFTDITPEEEVSVQGGNMFFSSSCPPLIAALKAGRLAVQAVIKNFPNWFAQPDNGIIFWNKKGTKDDGIRAGAGIAKDRDVPGSAKKISLKYKGKWHTFNV